MTPYYFNSDCPIMSLLLLEYLNSDRPLKPKPLDVGDLTGLGLGLGISLIFGCLFYAIYLRDKDSPKDKIMNIDYTISKVNNYYHVFISVLYLFYFYSVFLLLDLKANFIIIFLDVLFALTFLFNKFCIFF